VHELSARLLNTDCFYHRCGICCSFQFRSGIVSCSYIFLYLYVQAINEPAASHRPPRSTTPKKKNAALIPPTLRSSWIFTVPFRNWDLTKMARVTNVKQRIPNIRFHAMIYYPEWRDRRKFPDDWTWLCSGRLLMTFYDVVEMLCAIKMAEKDVPGWKDAFWIGACLGASERIWAHL